MKKAAFLLFILSLASCAPKQLYTWDKYENRVYDYYTDPTEENKEKLMQTLEKIIAKQKGTRGTVPPGIYSEYGMLLVQKGRVEEGKAMLNKEIELYPESKEFVLVILKSIEK
ncbi:MAG: DUF4810 domain-containing protein [Paludibacteraceae bacterium]